MILQARTPGGRFAPQQNTATTTSGATSALQAACPTSGRPQPLPAALPSRAIASDASANRPHPMVQGSEVTNQKFVIFLHRFAGRPPGLRSNDDTDQETLAGATFSTVGQHSRARVAYLM